MVGENKKKERAVNVVLTQIKIHFDRDDEGGRIHCLLQREGQHPQSLGDYAVYVADRYPALYQKWHITMLEIAKAIIDDRAGIAVKGFLREGDGEILKINPETGMIVDGGKTPPHNGGADAGENGA